MKRALGTILLVFCFCFIFSFKAFAAENIGIKATVNGTIEKDKQIEILIDIDDIKSLYAASVYYKYDPSSLRIDEIIPGELISDTKISKFEAIKNIDQSKGLVSYGFTCMGDINGFSGKGNLIKLKATVLEAKDFKLTSKFGNKTANADNTVAIQICDKDIQELPYNFKSFAYTAPKVQNAPTNNSNNTNTTEKENTANNPTTTDNVEVVNNDTTTSNDENKETTSGTNEDNKVVKKPMEENSTSNSNNLIYLLGGLGIVALSGFGYYKFKNKKQ